MFDTTQLKLITLNLARTTHENRIRTLSNLQNPELLYIDHLAERVIIDWNNPYILRAAYLRLSGEIRWVLEARLV